MILSKWNFKTCVYEPYDSPAGIVSVFEEDLSAPCDCANCGKRMTFGEGYTSLTIHNDIGFGYPVCDECYEKEQQDRREANQ